MANNINVKVKRTKLIKAVQTAIKERENNVKKEEASRQNRDKQEKDWLQTQFNKLKDSEPVSIRSNVGAWESRLIVEFELKAKKPEAKINHYNNYSANNELEELKNALRLLEMSEQTEISTSSYGKISRYL